MSEVFSKQTPSIRTAVPASTLPENLNFISFPFPNKPQLTNQVHDTISSKIPQQKIFLYSHFHFPPKKLNLSVSIYRKNNGEEILISLF